MNALTTAFAGELGLAEILVRTLGGSASLRVKSPDGQYVEKEIYCAQIDEWDSENASDAPNKRKDRASDSASNVLRRREKKVEFVAPASMLDAPPKPFADLFVRDGLTYRIESVETYRSESTPILYRFICVRS